MEMPCTQLPEHELSKCRWRGVPCPACHAEVRAYQLKDHKKKDCPRRPVKCRLGCGREVAFEDREYHEERVCKQPCQWDGCGLRIGPEEHRRLHERLRFKL